MPFYTINTSLKLDKVKKKKIAKEVTALTVNLLKVASDKVQTVVKQLDREEISRSGVTVDDDDFSLKSRVMNYETMESYYDGVNQSEDLVVIEIDIWDCFSIDKKKILVESLNKFFVDEFNVRGDNILILIRDMMPSNWIQNGILGGDKNFLQKSRTY